MLSVVYFLMVKKFENKEQFQVRFQDKGHFPAIYLEEPFDLRSGYISQTLAVECQNLK